MDMHLLPCLGCGGHFPETDGPTHRYLGSSPGCWACFGDVLAREYSDLRYHAVHRLTVDAYAVQHPGEPSPQTIRSVALHLMSLCAVLEQGATMHEATGVLQAAARDKERFVWLPPPASMGPMTVADVHKATDPQEHARLVRAWAASAWSAWAVHHEQVRTWLSDYRKTPSGRA
jgi:hypothetical protein